METKDINNVSEIIQGCDSAMINYALTDDMNLVRTVTFYNAKDTDLEHVMASQNYLCKIQGNISISKSVIYKILSLASVIKRGICPHVALFKNIQGYPPDPEYTCDCRTNKAD